MELKTLQKFIKTEHQRMLAMVGRKESQKMRTLFRTIKLMEEMGELAEEILGFTAVQRSPKMRPQNKEKLAEELADVIIVVLLLSRNLKVDVWAALEKKTRKIALRYQ